MAGQLTKPTTQAPSPEQLTHFLEGDSVEVSAAIGAQVGVVSSPGGTAAEIGIGLVQASGQFQHNWHLLDVPVRW